MFFQSENSGFKCGQGLSVYFLLKNNYKKKLQDLARFLPPQSWGSLSQSVVLFDICTRMSVILYPMALHATLNCTAMFTFGFKTLVRFVDTRFAFTDQHKGKKIYIVRNL